MIYRVCEHYDDNHSFDLIDANECFICFEIKTINELKPFNLKNQTVYLKSCKCDGSIHNECLKTWISKNKKCPICRTKVFDKISSEIIILNYISRLFIIFIYFKKVLLHLLKIIFFCFFLHSSLEVYLYIRIKQNEYNKNFINNSVNNTYISPHVFLLNGETNI